MLWKYNLKKIDVINFITVAEGLQSRIRKATGSKGFTNIRKEKMRDQLIFLYLSSRRMLKDHCADHGYDFNEITKINI